MIVLTLGFGGKDSACFGSRDWPETPSFFRCVSVPEYCSCTRENIRIEIWICIILEPKASIADVEIALLAEILDLHSAW